jgi:uncharacterized protein
MNEEESRALEDYLDRVRSHYGSRLYDVVLFGSRARGDDGPDSDVDLAIILADGDWRFWGEKMVLADMTYEALMDSGLVIQSWPVARSAWDMPSIHHNRKLIEAMKRDGRSLREAA